MATQNLIVDQVPLFLPVLQTCTFRPSNTVKMSFVVLNFIYKSENGTEKVLNPILKSEFENLPLLWIVENADFNFSTATL